MAGQSCLYTGEGLVSCRMPGDQQQTGKPFARLVNGVQLPGSNTVTTTELIDTKPAEALPEVPALGETNPEYADYLPWGPFFGVFVKNGTPEDVVAKLVDAYAKGAESEDFVKLMGDRGYVIESLSGDAATQFLSKWQSLTTWLIADAGLAKKSPEEFGIPRP